jgi:HK97 family phage major capsid protein
MKNALKIMKMDDESYVVGGYGVIFGGRDLVGDRFTKDTDFMLENASGRMPAFYDHAMGEIKGSIGIVTKIDPQEAGLWMEAQVMRSEDYAEQILALVESGRLGYSTGSASHLVEMLEGNIVKRWPIFELSLTPTPCEPRTLGVDHLKTIGVPVPVEGYVPEGLSPKGFEPQTVTGTTTGSSVINIPTGIPTLTNEGKMTPEEIKALVSEAITAAIKLVKDATEPLTEESVKALVLETIKAQPNQPTEDSAELIQVAMTEAVKAALVELTPLVTAEPKVLTAAPGVLTRSAALKAHTQLGGDHDGTEAFKHWCRTGQDNYYTKAQQGAWNDPDATKAALQEGTAAEGGVLVPEGLYERIVAKRDESSIPHRAGATIINTGLDSIQVPSEDATGAFALTAEEAAYNSSDATFTSNVITIYKFTNTTKVSEELLDDDQTDLEAFLAGMWGRSLAAMYNQYTIKGTGSGQPGGITVGGTEGIVFAAVAAITAAELIELYHALPEHYSAEASWSTSNATLGALRALVGDNFMFNPTPMGNQSGQELYTAPVYVSGQYEALAAAKKVITLSNWGFYGLAERAGLMVSRNPYLYQANGQVGFFVKARWGGAVLQAEAFQYGLTAAS